MEEEIITEPAITEASYPPRPEMNEKKQAIGKSLLSLGLFILVFYLFLSWDLKSIFLLTLALIIHEMGHLLAMKAFGYKDVNMFFVPLLGAYVTGTKSRISQKQHVIMLLAGPVPGIFIGLGLAIAGYILQQGEFFGAANIFVFMNLFNLLPVMPLDGGKVMKAMFFESKELINTVFISISIVILIVLCVVLDSYYLLLVPYLLIMQLVNQSQAKKARQEIRNLGIDLSKTYEELTDREYWMIRDVLAEHIKYYSKLIRRGEHVVIVNEDKVISGVNDILQTPPVKDLGAGGKVLIIFIGISCFIVPVVTAFLYHYYLSALSQQQFQF
jgi:stage IV sporulation protein FB